MAIYDGTTKVAGVNIASRYVSASAGSNGDFYVTSVGTLATNDVVYINFPTATNSASAARLSVNGGTNYYAINSGIAHIASSVESQRMSFVFDGTNFVPLDAISGTYTPTITAETGTFTTVSATGHYTKIGNLVTVRIQITMTNKGTATGYLYASLPYPSVRYETGSFCSVVQAGGGFGTILSNDTSSSTASLISYSASTIISTGRIIVANLTYSLI